MKVKYIYLMFLIVSFQILPQANGIEEKNEEKERKFFIFGSVGKNLSAPNGSFVKHEKLYDQTQNLQLANKQLTYIPPYDTVTPSPKSSQYTSGGFFKMGFEYLISDSFGIGSSLGVTNIWSKRSSLIVDPRDGKTYLSPISLKDDFQLSLTSMTVDFYYHFLEIGNFKPFAAINTGIVFVDGIAHQGYNLAYDRQDEQIHNGRGVVYGASIGANFFFNDYIGVRPEFIYTKYDFQADEFSTRSYNNNFFNMGLFYNY